jgi:hypothetical protein
VTLSRARRQVPSHVAQEFPDEHEDTTEKQNPQATLDRERNASDYFNDQIAADVTKFIITNLTHYRTYSISIRACRKLGEKERWDFESVCSHEVSEYQQTLRNPMMDQILSLNVTKEMNGSSYDVVMKWDPPESPNGMILSYQIVIKRDNADNTFQTICVPGYKNFSKISKDQLLPGKYDIEIKVKTLAGENNNTIKGSVTIDEQSSTRLL